MVTKDQENKAEPKSNEPKKKTKCATGNHWVAVWDMHQEKVETWLNDAQKAACAHLSGISAWKAVEYRNTDTCNGCVQKAIAAYTK